MTGLEVDPTDVGALRSTTTSTFDVAKAVYRCPSRSYQTNVDLKRNQIFIFCKTKYKMSPSSVHSEGGEAAAGYCLNSVSYRVDEAVKYNVLNSD